MKRARGLTLVEVLVVLTIVVALLTVLLPALAGGKRSARRAETLANLRSNGQIFAIYTGDWDGRWPCFTSPGMESNTIYGAGTGISGLSYFDAHWTWHIAMADQYLSGSIMNNDSVFPPGYELAGEYWPMRTAYYYGCTFIADPGYWSAETRSGEDQYRATTVSEVRFTSAKALLVEAWPLGEQVSQPADQAHIRIPVTLCDGSAMAVASEDRLAGYSSGDGYDFVKVGAVHFNDFPPMLHTLDGVRGRDISR